MKAPTRQNSWEANPTLGMDQSIDQNLFFPYSPGMKICNYQHILMSTEGDQGFRHVLTQTQIETIRSWAGLSGFIVLGYDGIYSK